MNTDLSFITNEENHSLKERFDMLTEQLSLPFKSGKREKAAAKVIDPRVNEVMKVVKLG